MRPLSPWCCQLVLLMLVLAAACAHSATQVPASPSMVAPLDVTARPGTAVLVFSRDMPFAVGGASVEFRDTTRTKRIDAMQRLGQRHGYSVERTEEIDVFTQVDLSRFSAIVFLNTSPVVLTSAGKAALQTFVRGGGGLVGIDALQAYEQERTWTWFRDLVGTDFNGVVHGVELTVERTDSLHLATRATPRRWVRNDGWMEFGAFSPDVRILATLDESARPAWPRGHRSVGPPYPITWAHEFDGGRAWFTGLGSNMQNYSDPVLLNHLAGGILWAAGR